MQAGVHSENAEWSLAFDNEHTHQELERVPIIMTLDNMLYYLSLVSKLKPPLAAVFFHNCGKKHFFSTAARGPSGIFLQL